ncbi:MAG: hypothetical protein OXL37_07680 [Chloroflexota bacterium]|nr:hypothetical protein [Chloroflexota bacterium]MDE2960324.1 hypothetical protein [Chloroflexota bacterium]
MSTQPEYDANSEAVRTHLTILQDVIRRMADNSASCKNWCVVLVAAILVLVARTDTTDYALLALLPTLLFLFLDAYYLALEQVFRNSYNAFVLKLHSDGGIALPDLYVVRPTGAVNKQLPVSLRSTAVWPFYLMLVIAIALVWKFDCIKALLGF